MTTRSRFSVALLVILTALPGLAFGQTFTRITDGAIGTDRGNTLGAAWVDYDGDGDTDLFVPNAAGIAANLLYRNEGNGSFSRITEGVLADDPGIAALGTCWADYDNDGDLDAFNAGAPNSFLYRNDGKGVFTKIVDGDIGGASDNRGWSCAWGDYDADGHVDLFIAHPAGFLSTPIPNTLFKNDGDGSFTRITDTPITDGIAPYTVGNWIDYDDDGDLDLFVGSGPAIGTLGPDFLFRNRLSETGSASFERITDSPLNDDHDGQTWNFIDYDNDGDRDGFVTNYWGGFPSGMPNSLYRNTNGVYTAVTDGPLVTDEAFSLANVWADFDNDGDLDVFITNEFGFDNAYYRNDGAPDFTFTRTDDFAGTTLSNYGATAGDYDLDGDLDLFFPSGGGGGNHLYRNDAPADNGWISIRMVGDASNGAGVGAQIRARAIIARKPVWQRREVSTQNTFNGHNSLDVHFGLGDASEATTLEIAWPSGTVDVATDVEANTFYAALEGEGLIDLSEYLLLDVKTRVEALVAGGVLTAGQGGALRTRMNAAIDRIRQGNDRAAAGLVQGVSRQIASLLADGVLSEIDARDLLDPAGTILTLLGADAPAASMADLGEDLHAETPAVFALSQNHPNPFNPSTAIAFTLPEEVRVTVSIYDARGRQVATLIDGVRAAGRHEVVWDAQHLASGVYLYRMQAGSFSESRLMHLMK